MQTMTDRKKAREAANAEFEGTFMTQLKRHMLAAGLDQRTLAKRCDVSDAAVSRWMAGRIPKGSNFKKLSRVLGVAPLALTQVMDPSDMVGNGGGK